MYIERHDFVVRPGCLDDAVALVKNEVEVSGAKARVLTPNFAQFDHLVMEIAFQEMADHEKFWEQWFNLPTTPTFFEQWLPLVLSGGSTTLWQVKEPAAGFLPGTIVNRRTFLVKPGKMDEVVELLKGESGTANFEVSTATFGPSDMIACDFVFDSLAAYEQMWGEWGSSERADPFFEKWFQLIEPGGTNEIWEVK